MNIRTRSAASMAVLALSLSLLACTSSGGNAKKSSTAPSSTAVASATESPTLGGPASSSSAPTTTITTAATPPPPTATVLTASLSALLDPSVPVAKKTSLIVGGTGLGPTLTAMEAAVKRQGAGTISFVISRITSKSTVAHALVDVRLSGRSQTPLYPGTWTYVGGTWAVTRAGFCSIVPAAAVNCPTTPPK